MTLKTSPRSRSALIWLTLAAGLLAAVSSLAGLLWRGSGGTRIVQTVTGDEVELYGRGLYENDSLFFAGNNLATDIVTLLLALPLLLVAFRLLVRGSARGRLLLVGVLGYLLYCSSSYALGGVAYNELFLVYVAYLSASLFAFISAVASLVLEPVVLDVDAPRRLAGVFMIVSGIATLGIWLMEPLGAVVSGDQPASLETHTTLFTHALDIAVIVPAAIAAGVLILSGRSIGYTVAFSLLVLEAMLLPLITIATAIQIGLGIEFEPPEIIGPIAGFSLLAAFALRVIIRIFRALEPDAPLYLSWSSSTDDRVSGRMAEKGA